MSPLPCVPAGRFRQAELVIVAEGVFSDPWAKRLPARTAGRSAGRAARTLDDVQRSAPEAVQDGVATEADQRRTDHLAICRARARGEDASR